MQKSRVSNLSSPLFSNGETVFLSAPGWRPAGDETVCHPDRPAVRTPGRPRPDQRGLSQRLCRAAGDLRAAGARVLLGACLLGADLNLHPPYTPLFLQKLHSQPRPSPAPVQSLPSTLPLESSAGAAREPAELLSVTDAGLRQPEREREALKGESDVRGRRHRLRSCSWAITAKRQPKITDVLSLPWVISTQGLI